MSKPDPDMELYRLLNAQLERLRIKLDYHTDVGVELTPMQGLAIKDAICEITFAADLMESRPLAVAVKDNRKLQDELNDDE